MIEFGPVMRLNIDISCSLLLNYYKSVQCNMQYNEGIHGSEFG